MPGLARFKPQQQEQRRHERFFGDDLITMACATNDAGESVLVFGLRVGTDQAFEYRKLLEPATLRVSSSDDAMALDVLVDRRCVGRITTSFGNDVLSMAVAHMQARDTPELKLSLVYVRDGRGDHTDVTLPVEYLRVTEDELHGDTIEIGVGPFTAMTMDLHTGRIYCQRFTSQAQAEAQVARNAERDLPFVGLKAS